MLFCLCLMVATANAAQGPAVYPVKSIFGFYDSELASRPPVVAAWLTSMPQGSLSQEYQALFRKSFGAVAVDTIKHTERHKTMLASLHLVRASHYTVPKGGVMEHHFPLTLSISFTNPASGDLLYSFTGTSYAAINLGTNEAPEQSAEVRKAIADNYRSLLDKLITEASRNYNPAKIEASVAKVWKKLAVLDKGSKYGVGLNDQLEDDKGNMVEVIRVTEDYAIARSMGSPLEKGQKYSKYANQDTAKAVKKPRVLTMHKGWNDAQLTTIAGLFDSEVSKESAFTLLPVNEGLAALLSSATSETGVSNEIKNSRSMPDYLIKFTASKPRLYDIHEPGKFGYKVYEQYILGELLDKQGRIIYSAVGKDKIEDKDVAGMVFDTEARLEILRKNAVKDMAGQFSTAIKFANFVLLVTKNENGQIELTDTARQVRFGQNLLIFRNIGEVDGIRGDVLIPVQQVAVASTANGTVKADLLGEITDELKGVSVAVGDVAIFDALSSGKAGEADSGVTYCTNQSSKTGVLNLDDFSVISRGFGYLLPYPLYDADAGFRDKVQTAIRSGGFKESELTLGKLNTGGRCILPVYKASIEKQQCDSGSCELTVSLASGYRPYLGQERKKGAAQELKINLDKCRDSSLHSIIQTELTRSALGLLRDNITRVRF
jgi:hypothetical protein